MQVRTHVIDDLPPHLATTLNDQSLLGSISFAALWNEMGGSAIYWVLYDDDRPLAILPSVRFGRGVLARLQAMPDGLYSRIVCLDKSVDGASAGRQLIEAIASSGFAKVYINDFSRQLSEVSGFESLSCRTNIVKLNTETWLPPDKKLQSEIRKAQREDVPVDEFSLDRHFDSFLDLMRRTESRHGRRPKYSPAFYERLAVLAQRDRRVRWLVCEKDGKLAASHIYLVEGDMLLNWQVFFDKQFSPLKPNQLITYSIACELSAQGITRLNLGASPGDAETLAYYKDKWGGETYSYPCWSHRSWIGRLM